MTTLAFDLRFASRMSARQPGFTATAVLVLALGVAANAAVFTVFNTLLLRPLPGVRDPATVVGVYARSAQRADVYRGFSYPNYVDIRDGVRSLEAVAAFTFALSGVTEGDVSRRSLVLAVSSNYFSLLGSVPRQGRAFTAAEESPAHAVQVAVVSHAYWQRRGSDTGLIGRSVTINGRSFTIVGIAPPGFAGTATGMAPELWIPLGASRLLETDFLRDIAPGDASSRDSHKYLLLGRLRGGTTQEAANTELSAIAARLAEAYPAANRDFTIVAATLQRWGLATTPGDDARFISALVILLCMSGVVLIVACLNLANMLLARGTARRREIAIRLSLGGSRLTIVRQLLLEGLLLAAAGGAIGLVAGHWAMVLLIRSVSPLVPIPLELGMQIDWRMAAATLTCCALATLTFALGPAVKATRPDVVEELREQAGELRGRRAWLFGGRNLLLAGQVGLSLALLVSGALFVRSALAAADAKSGLDIDRNLLVEVDPSLAAYSLGDSAAAHRRAVARLRELPGLEAATMASLVPLGTRPEVIPIAPASGGQAGSADGTSSRTAAAVATSVGADYFRTVGLRLLRGRDFTAEEAEGREPHRVAIIDEPAAKHLFPRGENPIGRYVEAGVPTAGAAPDVVEIVGIVPGVRSTLQERGPSPHIYLPFSSRVRVAMYYHVRLAPGGPGEPAMTRSLRRTLIALDPRLPVLSIKSADAFVQGSLFLWLFRAGARILTAFGLAALVLAVAGIYGVSAYIAARRTREMAIRMALGASPRDVIRLVVRDTTVVTVLGLVAGTALALVLGRVLGALLYEVSPTDPVALVLAPALLAASALTAAYLPARRAASLPVTMTMRGE